MATDTLAIWPPVWDRNNPHRAINVSSVRQDADTRTYGVGREGSDIMEVVLIQGNKVKIHPWTTNAKTVEYNYTPRPDTLTWDSNASTDVPVLDAEWRFAIADYALYFLLNDKKDIHATEAITVAQAFISKMKAKHVRQQGVRMYPRPGSGIWR